MKKKMWITIGIIVVIVIAAVIMFRPSRWKDDGEMTKVKLTVNGKSIPVEFNSTRAAQEVLAKMPFELSFTPSRVDYCGSLGAISYDNSDVHAGWANGDIIYMTNGDWYSIFTGAQNSVVPGNLTLGYISSEYLDEVKSWRKQGSVRATFEIA